MIICICQNVSERDIGRAVSEGCHSFPALQEELEIGRACGTCLCSARECFAEQKAACRAARGGQQSNTGMMPLAAAI
ncbi:MAG: (2Fe-2S)-binding protein [Pseudomonadota bacterium]